MTSKDELDEGIKSIQNAYRREHTARTNLAKMLESAELENAKLRELAEKAWKAAEKLCQAFEGSCGDNGLTIYEVCPMGERDEECVYGQLQRELRELGIEVRLSERK